jgi:hypothetical protein
MMAQMLKQFVMTNSVFSVLVWQPLSGEITLRQFERILYLKLREKLNTLHLFIGRFFYKFNVHSHICGSLLLLPVYERDLKENDKYIVFLSQIRIPIDMAYFVIHMKNGQTVYAPCISVLFCDE